MFVRRVAEVEVWTRTKILSPNIRYFVAKSRIVAIYTLFGGLSAKMCLFGSNTVHTLGNKCTITWDILHIILN